MDTAMQVLCMGNLQWVESLYGDPIEFLAGTVRGGITTPEGYELVVADLSSIESRFVGWLTGCKWINETFKNGLDTYKRFAVSVFNVAYDEVTKQQRKFAKPCVLGAPYGLGAKGLVEYAEGFDVVMTEEEAQHHTKTFRQTCHEIPTFWRWLEYVVQAAVIEGVHTTGYYLEIFTEGEFLFIRLPSGRRISYHLPKIEPKETPWGEVKPTLTSMGTNRFKPSNPWERVKAHMGMITENCLAVETEILTRDGWKRLDTYNSQTDELWDGDSFVKAGKLLDKGIQQTIEFEGVNLTPDHYVFTRAGWFTAGELKAYETPRSYWTGFRLPYCDTAGSIEKRPDPMGNKMRLWEVKNRGYFRTRERRSSILRMPDEETDLLGECHSRDVKTRRLRDLAFDDKSLSFTLASGLSKLWRSWHKSLYEMGEVFFCLLGRYGLNMAPRFDTGAIGQQSRVFSDELSMENIHPSSEQSSGEPFDFYTRRGNDSSSGCGEIWGKNDNASLSARSPMANTASFRSTQLRMQKVYDIANSGPRHRFTVRGKNKVPFLVHNCVQAGARDILVHGLMLADQAGLDVRGHIHDEVIVLTPEDKAENHLQILRECMSVTPDWAPGLLLAAEGYTAKHYTKT